MSVWFAPFFIGSKVRFKKDVTLEDLKDNAIDEPRVSRATGVVVGYPCDVQFPGYSRPWSVLGLVEKAK